MDNGKEELNLKICQEYEKRGKQLSDGDNPLFVGARRDLAEELMNRCGIPELWAFNIVNGHNTQDYISIVEYMKNGGEKKKPVDKDEMEYYEWLAEKEDKERIERMIEIDEQKL